MNEITSLKLEFSCFGIQLQESILIDQFQFHRN